MTGNERQELTTLEGSTPFNHLFGFKALEGGQEVTYNGATGIYVEGYCAVWEPTDRVGDTWDLDISKGSTSRKALEDYFKNNPIVLFEHGRDQHVGKKALGQTVEWKIDDYGVWVKDFIQRPEKSAWPLYDTYQKIKSGVYRTFSICGRWAKDRKSTIIELLDVFEHSVAAVPVAGEALFTLSKALEFQQEYGIDVEEALSIAIDSKAGAMFSRSNKSKIQQAIAVLEDLIGESDEDDGVEPGNEPGETMPMATVKGGASTGTRTKGKPNPFTGVRGSGKSLVDDEERPVAAALNNTKGVTKTMSAKTQDKPNVEGGDQDQDTVTFTGADAKAIRDLLSEREELKKEREATVIAEKALAEERKAAEETAEAERKYEEDVQAKALEIGKKLRLGSSMNFGGDSASYKSFNVNRGATKNEFSILKFAKYGMQSREWQYIEEQKSLNAEYKALNETVGSAGGFLVPTQQSTEIVDLLRAQAVVRQMPGVRVIPMTSDTMTMPRLTGGATAYWGAEGASLTTSQETFGQLRWVARKLYAVVAVTKEMMNDSNPGIEQIVREDIAAALALKEDDAFLQGSGIGETPLGILNAGIGTAAFVTGTASAAPEYSALIKAAAIVRNNNAKPNGMVMHSRISDKLLGVLDTTGQPITANAIGGFRWADIQAAQGRTSNDPNKVQFGMLLGMTQANANQLTVSATTTGTGTVLLGDWSKVLIGDRQDLELEVDRSLGFLSDVVYIKVTKRCDIVVSVPLAFSSITAFPALDVA